VRLQGKREYAAAFSGTLDPFDAASVEARIKHAESAAKFFLEASKLASETKYSAGNIDDWLAAKKNLGMTSLRLATMEGLSCRSQHRSRQWVLFHFKESLTHLSEAFIHANAAQKNFPWLDEIASRIKESCSSALEFIIDDDATAVSANYSARLAALTNLLSEPYRFKVASAALQVLMADQIIKAAIISEEAGDFNKEYYWAVEAERPIIECTSALGSIPKNLTIYSGLNESLEELQAARWIYLARSESARARLAADLMRDQLMFENEAFDMELFYTCVDDYRHAMSLASAYKEQCAASCMHEQEAIAAAQLGSLFEKGQRLYKQARVLYMHAIRLSEAITDQSGSTFQHCSWYQIAKKGILEDNKRNEAFDNEKVSKERAPVLLKLKPELDAITAAVKSFEGRDYSVHALLVHLYSKHPPKDGKWPSEAIVTVTVAGSVVTAIDVTTPGSGYVAGDVLTIPAGFADGTGSARTITLQANDFKGSSALVSTNLFAHIGGNTLKDATDGEYSSVSLTGGSGGPGSAFDVRTFADKNDSSAVQKAALRACTRYHPDRPFNKSAGIEWFILSGEISKELNSAYARYKG
jgi:hypothetical protein